MASDRAREFPTLTVEERSTGLYKWMTLEYPEESGTAFLKEVYDEQAPYYDSLLLKKMGWNAWKEGTDETHKQIDKFGYKKDVSILDAGAGTGLVGQKLSELGYTNIAALDISSGMLHQCKEKGCYNKFVESDLNIDRLEDYKSVFDVVVAMGIFSRRLVRAHALRTLQSCVKKGGLMCISFRAEHYEVYGFRAMCDELMREGSLIQVGRQDTGHYYRQGMNGHYFTYQVL